jgi:hypothetical protein
MLILKFLDRHDLSTRSATHKAQENNKTKEHKAQIVGNYLKQLDGMISKFEPQYIIQMDETPTYIDMITSRTIDTVGKKSIEVSHTGQLKSRFTSVITIAANGYRLPTYLVLRKLKKPPSNLVTNTNISIHVSDSGFMDSFLMEDYIDRVIVPYIGNNECLLVLDDYAAHKTASVIAHMKSKNITPFLIPGGLTFCLQPLDVSINKPFKDELRKQWKFWFENSSKFTKGGNISKPTWQQTISMVDM